MSLQFSLSEDPSSFGHHFIIGLSGPELSDMDKRLLAKLRPVGVLLLARNFDSTLPYPDWLRPLKKLIRDIGEYSEREKSVISIDHEGGKVHRTPKPFTHFPAAIHYASEARAVARAMATELKSIAVNVSWAPVADIHTNAENPVIGHRAFATTPTAVSEKTSEYAEELVANGVAACAKHFPGHGDTSTDSHLELPYLTTTKEELFERELVPFRVLIQRAIPLIMTGHIKFPEIDEHFPATFSERILREILRDELGFTGVLVADDVEMKAVAKAFTDFHAPGKALNAGCDLFLVSRFSELDSEHPINIANQFFLALKHRIVREDVLNESFQRIAHFHRTQILNYSVSELSQEIFEQHGNLARELTP